MKTATGILFVSLALGLNAAPWKKVDGGFVWQDGACSLAITPKGALTARGTKGTSVSLAFFQWHDKYIYERLEAGKTDAPPTIADDGTLRLGGLWGTRDGVPPLRYALTLKPDARGMGVTLQVRKTGELKIVSGIWASMHTSFTPEDGRRAYASPGPCSPLGSSLGGACRDLFVELGGRQALVLGGSGFRTFRSKLSKNEHLFEMCLNPAKFAVGETSTTTFHLRFAPMPTHFPGTIQPAEAPLAIGHVKIPSSAALYDTVELEVELLATWTNPFDPDEVALDALVSLPSGRSYTLPGFFTLDHERMVEGDTEMMIPQGVGRWLVRLAATEVGALRCELRARDRSGVRTKTLPPIEVTKSRARGFLRQSDVDPRQLGFDNGEGFLPIGHNLPIYPVRGQLVDEALAKMAAAGENYNRWWMSNSGLGLEWMSKLGRYRQPQSARIDFVLELARKHGMYYMMCMDTHQDFRKGGWRANPFNAENGGPCKTVEDWFTNPEARQFYRKRLRYTVARWTASPHVLAWEFGNEFEGWANCKRSAVLDWHREMSAYLDGIDPYNHLITTSWWSKTGPEEFWALPHIDIVQTHCYTNNDRNVAEALRDYCLHQWNRFEKPHIFGEFGIRSHSTTAEKDPDGRALHNAYWACLASGASGIAMPWWHRNYIDPLDLYFHFTSIQRFATALPYGTERWRQLKIESLDYVTKPDTPETKDVRLKLASSFRKRKVTDFTVAGDGTINDPGELLDLLHGAGHKDLQAPPTFHATFPAPGRFVLKIGRVSKSGQVRIHLDGVCVLDKTFPCGKGHGKSWQFRKQWNLWESIYDEVLVVEIPAGRHQIKVENLGEDWVKISACELQGALTVLQPNVLVAGLAADSAAFVWLQNRDSSWHNHHNAQVKPARPPRIVLSGFRNGRYRMEWWETWKGNVTRSEEVTIQDKRLVLTPGTIATDVAVKLIRMGE